MPFGVATTLKCHKIDEHMPKTIGIPVNEVSIKKRLNSYSTKQIVDSSIYD